MKRSSPRAGSFVAGFFAALGLGALIAGPVPARAGTGAGDPVPTGSVPDRLWPRAYGGSIVCFWKDDKLAPVSITIDDNHAEDHPFWLTQGDTYGWRWTWFVIVGRIGTSSTYGDWSGWQEIVNRGHDVQSHSMCHLQCGLTIEEEYAQSQATLDANLTNTACKVLAYPNGYQPPNDRTVAAEYYLAGRGVVGVLNKASAIDYMVTSSISGAANFFEAESHWASFAGILNPANSQKFRAWYVCHFHGVGDPSLRSYIVDILDYLQSVESDVWVGTFREVAMYGQERETSSVATTEAGADRIRFTVSDTLPDDPFDYPLTVKVRLDDAWSGVEAEQGGVSIPAERIEHDGAVFALVQAVPDGGEVVLTRPASGMSGSYLMFSKSRRLPAGRGGSG